MSYHIIFCNLFRRNEKHDCIVNYLFSKELVNVIIDKAHGHLRRVRGVFRTLSKITDGTSLGQ